VVREKRLGENLFGGDVHCATQTKVDETRSNSRLGFIADFRHFATLSAPEKISRSFINVYTAQ